MRLRRFPTQRMQDDQPRKPSGCGTKNYPTQKTQTQRQDYLKAMGIQHPRGVPTWNLQSLLDPQRLTSTCSGEFFLAATKIPWLPLRWKIKRCFLEDQRKSWVKNLKFIFRNGSFWWSMRFMSYSINEKPIGSMGLVYLPTSTIKIKQMSNKNRRCSRWCFQPIWKIWVKLEILPN